eukprot:gene15944-18800_t
MLDLSLKSGRCGPFLRADAAPVQWAVSEGYVDYPDAVAAMEARVASILDGSASELVWLLEHPPVYTAGTSAVNEDLLDARFDVVEAGRGGRHTYHGPGQRSGYLMLDLRRRNRDVRGPDVRRFVHAVEGWVIDTLGDFGVEAWRAP